MGDGSHLHTLAVCLSLLASASAAAPTTSLGSLISWQQHGWDDIREWRTAWIKGSWAFKLDFNFQPEEYCAMQSHVPQPADPRGCFLMIHTPTALSTGKNGPFSSTNLLSLLADPANRQYLVVPARRKLIALRFYSFPPTPCDGSQTSNDWLSLTDDFYAASNDLIDKLDLNVEIYYDQFDYTQPCILERWPRWVSTWDQSAFPYTDQRIFDNNVTNHNDRTQVLNRGEALPQLQDLAAHKWYKFADSKYPLVVYEPSDEDAINIITDIYLSSNFNHTPGYLLAFNNDPVMYQLYTSSRSSKAIHQPFTNDLGFQLNTTVSLRNLALRFSWPQVATLDTSGDGSSFLVITVYRNNVQQAKYLVQSGTAPVRDTFVDAPPPAVVFSNYTKLISGDLPNATLNRISSISAFKSKDTYYVLVGDDSALGSLYTLDINTGVLTPFASFALPAPPQAQYAGNALTALVVDTAPTGTVHLVLASAGTTHANGIICSVWTQLYLLNISSPTSATAPTAYGQPICTSAWAAPTKVKVITGTAVHVSVSAAAALSSSRCSYSPVYGNTQALEVYVAYGNRFGTNQVGMTSEVYLSQVCIDLNYGGASNAVIPTPAIRPPVFTVGDFPSVSALTVPSLNTTTVLLVSTNGFCPNSFMRDDTPTGQPMMCAAYSQGFGSPVVGVMTYAHGDSHEIARRLSKAANTGIITNVCDDHILHGNYDQGYQPTVSLIHTPLGFVANEVHAGLASLAQNDCGSPSPVDGLVLDAWLLAEPSAYSSTSAYGSTEQLISQAAAFNAKEFALPVQQKADL